jgi:CHAD domain-containing protein
MTTIPLHFELPENLTAKKFLSKLSKKIDFQITAQQHTIITFYDSFDWRLYNANIICEFSHSQKFSALRLIDRNSGELIALQEMQDIPSFSGQFPEGSLKKHLEPHLEMRALLPLSQIPSEVYRVNVLNKDQKIILRLQVDEYEFLTNCIHLQPLKGYQKAAKKVSKILQQAFELKPTHCTALNAALKQQHRKPKDYSSKVVIKLKPNMRAIKASKVIFRHLLQAMQVNEAGTISDTDTEILQEFRVSVRRTRACLTQMKNILPSSVIIKHSAFFASLGQITGATRDLDVYLLNYERYKEALPLSLREDIVPLYPFLKEKQVHAQKELADQLKSSKYSEQLTAWEQYLKEPMVEQEEGKSLTIKEQADQRIWKVYKRVLKEGEAIKESSPAEALHDLRKTCKKLRYLMEFFQSLYHEDDIKILIKALKNFQLVLGDFQDYEIQEIKLKQFSEEMKDNNVSTNTFLAMGVLVQYLDTKKCAARNDFSKQFAAFEQPKNQTIFKYLFAHKA